MVCIKVNQTQLAVDSLQLPQTRLNSCNVCGRWMTTELIQLTNQPKTVAVVTAISDVPIAESGTSATRVEAPRPTPQNTGRAGRRARWILCGRLLVVILFEVIVAPLLNVAVHVVQPKRTVMGIYSAVATGR
jgi:hypothetical protein